MLAGMTRMCYSDGCSVCVGQLVVVAYDHGEPVKENTTLVEITVLQPSVIPVFTQEEYRYTLNPTNTKSFLSAKPLLNAERRLFSCPSRGSLMGRSMYFNFLRLTKRKGVFSDCVKFSSTACSLTLIGRGMTQNVAPLFVLPSFHTFNTWKCHTQKKK